MTSSDDTALRPGAIAEVAQTVGVSYEGEARRAGPGGTRLRQVQRGHHRTASRRGPRRVEGPRCGARDRDGGLGARRRRASPGRLPAACGRAEYDAVIALGAVIRGDTAHFDFVAGECAAGLQRVALDTGVPVIFGVLTTDTVAQAQERAGPGETNKGYEAAVTALEMVAAPRMLPCPAGRRDEDL